MKVKAIRFTTDEVRATLDRHKTTKRLMVKPQPKLVYFDGRLQLDDDEHVLIAEDTNREQIQIVPPYLPGDILYVQETWSIRKSNDCFAQPCNTGICPYKSCETAEGPCFPDEYIYKATDSLPPYGGKWRPSIHMPREAARIWLQVTDMHVELLQDMTVDDALHEGASIVYGLRDFKRIWRSTINPKDVEHYSWAADPWVWVIEFNQCKRPESF